MSNYRWLVTAVHADGRLDLAVIASPTPDAGDLLLLDDGSIVTTVTRALYSRNDAEYKNAISLLPPKKVVRLYVQRKTEGDFEDAPA